MAPFMSDDEESLEPMPPTLENILESNLRWIFVGGKGGVGKTTTSCSLAVQLSLVRESVLVVSTDPAHNLSDAFGQKFTSAPTKVNGFPNLFCMEVEASAMQASMQAEMGDAAGLGMGDAAGGLQSLMKDLTNAVPGIDEAMSFAEIMKSVQSMEYSCIVFDTAPTGHTLRLLSMPNALEKAFAKITELKGRFGGLMGQAAAMMGGAGGAGMQEGMMGKLEATRAVVAQVNVSFKDPNYTTFVCVCIPEFLSLYETERLVQELTKFGIDAHNVVVNQVLFPEPDACRKFLARKRMQDKYLNQIHELYEDFHVVVMPMCDAEVRGGDALRRFSRNLVEPYEPVPAKDTSTEAVLESVAARYGLDLADMRGFLQGEGLLPPTDGGQA